MKKVIIWGSLALALVLGINAMSKPSETTTDVIENDDFEGQTIQNTGAKNWSVLINGKRYGYVSGAAFSNYFAKNPLAGTQNEIGDEAYNAYPEGGYIDETGAVIQY